MPPVIERTLVKPSRSVSVCAASAERWPDAQYRTTGASRSATAPSMLGHLGGIHLGDLLLDLPDDLGSGRAHVNSS
jgi:hypothetical protein